MALTLRSHKTNEQHFHFQHFKNNIKIISFSKGIAIDLGSAHTLILTDGKTAVEALSVVALLGDCFAM